MDDNKKLPQGIAITIENHGEQQIISLSIAQKDAIRWLRQLKFLVAKRRFRAALRPYDIKVITWAPLTTYMLLFNIEFI